MQGRATIQARRLKLKELMPDVELMQKTLGEMNGDAEFRGSGIRRLRCSETVMAT